MTIIKLSDTHYILVDDSEIKVGDIAAEKLLTGGYELFEIHTPNDIDEVRQKKVTDSTQAVERYYSATDGTIPFVYHKVKPLSLSEVEEAINGYSVEKIIRQYTGEEMDRDDKKLYAILHSVLKQYNELVKDKLFTIEQMNEVIAEAWNSCEDNEGETYTQVHKRIIQSLLPKTEWECTIDEQGKLKLI